MSDHLNDVIETIEKPELRDDDPRPGRMRSFRRCGPERWMRVILEFDGDDEIVVTAFPQVNDPPEWRE